MGEYRGGVGWGPWWGPGVCGREGVCVMDVRDGGSGVRAAAWRGWGKRVTAAAFWFFLAKGLAWLAVPAVVAYYAGA